MHARLSADSQGRVSYLTREPLNSLQTVFKGGRAFALKDKDMPVPVNWLLCFVSRRGDRSISKPKI